MITLAWRNLWRQPRRSLVTLLAVAVVVFLAIVFASFGGAFVNAIYQDLTARVGHVQVHAAGYRDARDMQAGLLANGEHVVEVAHRTVPDAEVLASLDVPALLAGAERSRGVVVTGRAGSAALLQRYADEHLSSGALPAGDDTTGVALGRALADALQVGVGDTVYAFAPGTLGYGAGAYRVTGLVRLDDPAAEARTALVTLGAAQELGAPGAVTSVELHFPSLRTVTQDARSAAAAATLRGALGAGYQVEAWRELDPTLQAILRFINPVLAAFTGLFFILAGLLVVNTVYLSTLERVREFGLIVSLGASGRQVIGMITLESVVLCLTGAAGGAAAGLGLVAVLSRGFEFPGMEGLYQAIGLNPVLYPSVSALQVVSILAFAVLVAIVAALWPATMAARIEPTEAMRFTV